jgi:single-strand DNA-binding protein
MLAKALVIGNLGRDPETRYTPAGRMSVSFSVASSRRWTDQNGQQQERTTWFNVTAWGRLAETLDQLTQSGYLSKGRQVYVSGRIELREYTDRNNQQRSSLDLNADEVLLVGGRGDGATGGAGTGGPGPQSGGPGGDLGDLDDTPF